jgi:hypothetical protein
MVTSGEEELRREIERALGDMPFSDNVWRVLRMGRYIERYVAGELTLDDLAGEIATMQALLDEPVTAQDAVSLAIMARPKSPMLPESARGSELHTPYEEARSLLVAAVARHQSVVIAMRIGPELVGRFPLAWGEGMVQWLREQASSPTGGRDQEYLPYVLPGEWRERYLPVQRGTFLWSIKMTSTLLGKRFAWTPAQAVVFMLTDIPPLLLTFRMSIDRSFGIPALRQVNMIVDPTLSPKEVGQIYSVAREQLLGSGGKHRDITEKHLQLALFATVRLWDGRTWADRMAEWNKEHPKWAYSTYANFSHDCLQAQRRLLGITSEEAVKLDRAEGHGGDGDE